jgi:hypothetical protein
MQIQRKVNFEPIQGTITETEKKQTPDSQTRKRDVFESAKERDASTVQDMLDDALEQIGESGAEQSYKLQQVIAEVEKKVQAYSAELRKYFELKMIVIGSYKG